MLRDDRGSRRYLIAIGSPECPGLELATLKRVARDVGRVVELFTSPAQGYERVLADEIPLGATAQAIQAALANWFTNGERRTSDCVLIYVAGHGDQFGKFNHHYLVTKDTTEQTLARRAIKTSVLVELFFEGSGERPQNILLVLDTCYSGRGGGQAVAAVAQAKGAVLNPEGSGFWVIASADSNTEAADGDFVSALLAVMEDDAWMPWGGKEFLNPLDLRDAINEWFKKNQRPQRSEADLSGSREEAVFVRNPRFTRQLDGLTLDDAAHWDLKARGVEAVPSRGWFFTGRTNALQKLVAWLRAETSDLKARVVTGDPGSGKSAVLARLVACAHPATRAAMAAAGVLPDDLATIPDPGSIDAAVHARGLGVERVAILLADKLRVDTVTVDGVLAAVGRRSTPARIVVDALDEAIDPLGLERELLRPLASCPSVRLVVGSRRRDNRVPLAGIREVIDLDKGEYFDASDIGQYITSRLTGRVPPTVYADPLRRCDAERIGKLVSRKAGRSFLYARIVSRWLGQATVPIDTSRAGWEQMLSLPADLPEAFGADLERFDPVTRRRWFDLLVPLAYSRGKGMPQKRIWAALASRVAGCTYSNDDIREFKATAGYYIVQDTESGEAVYRLFHQAFADYVVEKTRDENVDEAIAGALVVLATPEGETRPAWLQVHEPYLLNYLPAHAARAGRFEDLIEEPEFLLTMPAKALLPEFVRVSSPEARAVARSYRKVSHWMRSEATVDRLPYLRLAALQHGADRLAAGLAALPERPAWFPLWVWWRRSTPSEVVGREQESISALAIGTGDMGEPVAVVGCGGVVSVWSLTDARHVAASAQFKGAIRCLEIAVINGEPMVVAGWAAGAIRVFRLNSCELLGERVNGHTDEPFELTTLCVARRGGASVVVSSGRDLGLHVWSLPWLELIKERAAPHAAAVLRVVGVERGETSLVITGSDSCLNGKYPESILVRLWSLADLEVRLEIFHGNRDAAQDLQVLSLDGKAAVLITYWPSMEFELRSLADGRLLAPTSPGFNPIGVLDDGDEPLIIGTLYGQFQTMKIQRQGANDGEQSYALVNAGRAVPVREALWSPAIRVHGRRVLTSASASEVRVWDLTELLDATVTARGPVATETMMPEGAGLGAFTASAAHDVLAAGSWDGRVWLRRTSDGGSEWSAHVAAAAVIGLAFVSIDKSQVLVVGDQSGLLHVRDRLSSRPLFDPIRIGHRIESIAACIIDREPLCVVAANLNRTGEEGSYVVSVWNLQTRDTHRSRPREAYGAERKFTMSGWTDKPICCLATDLSGAEPVVLAGGPAGQVWAWGLTTHEQLWHSTLGNGYEYVRSLTTTTIAGQGLVLAGTDDGALIIADLNTGHRLQERLHAHRGAVTALAVFAYGSTPCLLSGGVDGNVTAWSPSLAQLWTIEVESSIAGIVPLSDRRLAVATAQGLLVLKRDSH